ncbi:MAG TPA: hypothetical protein VJR23_03770 [Candidatus Acidoferrales bacterium]|nr:hypothetical protein [Candidatus Acidoferrales bacterium]
MPPMSMWKKVNLLVTIVSVVVLLYAFVLILHEATPPDVPIDAQAAARAKQKIEAADLAKAAGHPAKVELDSAELSSYLHQNLALMDENGSTGSAARTSGEVANSDPTPVDPTASIPGADHATVEEVRSSVKDVRVDMVGDMIMAYVVFNIHGKDLSLELNGHLHAEDGYLKFEPVSGKLGSLPLPQSTLDAAVKRLMSSPENRENLKLPPDIADVRIENGQAVLIYK